MLEEHSDSPFAEEFEEEYHGEYRYHMHDMEGFTMSSVHFMDQQPEVRWHMRPALVDFLIEAHNAFHLHPATLYLALNIMDRYVSRRVVYLKHYQLCGCTALWVAAKYHDAYYYVPTTRELTACCNGKYGESTFIQMEGHILSTIGWTLFHPTPEAWLILFCRDPYVEEAKVQSIARFLMEITLFYREFLRYPPSAIASGALTLARYICDKPRRLWEQTDESLEVVDYLDGRLSDQSQGLSNVLVRKYAAADTFKASNLVVEYYRQGGRFVRPILPLSLNIKRTTGNPEHSGLGSYTASISDISDDM